LKYKGYIRKLKWVLISLPILLIAIVLLANFMVNRSSNEYVFDDINSIQHHKVGLLLGTSKYLRSGQPNQYFQNRINAAVELFNNQKIDFILVSGDNRKERYNEPKTMKNELLKAGIPSDKIYLDYAGFRTFDSVIRINKVFGQSDFTIISQEFHNRRAIFIAKNQGLDAIGYNAKDVSSYKGFKTNLREKFARVKVFIDLWFGGKPKFLGEKIEVK
jgi:SanA protein